MHGMDSMNGFWGQTPQKALFFDEQKTTSSNLGCTFYLTNWAWFSTDKKRFASPAYAPVNISDFGSHLRDLSCMRAHMLATCAIEIMRCPISQVEATWRLS